MAEHPCHSPPGGDRECTVAKLLLKRRDVNPNSPDRNGRTPLPLAASGGHEGVMKPLLDRGNANPNSPDIVLFLKVAKNSLDKRLRILFFSSEFSV